MTSEVQNVTIPLMSHMIYVDTDSWISTKSCENQWMGTDQNDKSCTRQKLEGHGRARREAARRRKSECKIKLSPRSSKFAVGLLPLPREEFRLLKLILHSELRRRAASHRALLALTVVCGPKFTGLFSWNAGGIAVDHISFRLWISGVVLEIFAMKVESCQKSRWISDVFSLSQILGGRPSKRYTHVYPCLEARCMENVLWGYSH